MTPHVSAAATPDRGIFADPVLDTAYFGSEIRARTAQRTVVLDAGHGGDDPGAATNGVVEAESNLDLAIRVEALLVEAGYRVVLTRRTAARTAAPPPSDDVLDLVLNRVDLQARVDLANAVEADVFVSLHSNGQADAGVNGVEVWYDPNRPFGSLNRDLATRIQERVIDALHAWGYPAADRGVRDDTCWRVSQRSGRCLPLFVLAGPSVLRRADVVRAGRDPAAFGLADGEDARLSRPASMPGVLVELLFVSNVHDAAVLRDADGRNTMARAIADAIVAYLQEGGGTIPGRPGVSAPTP